MIRGRRVVLSRWLDAIVAGSSNLGVSPRPTSTVERGQAGERGMGAKKSMTCWYDPAMLADTAVLVAISTVFGEFADKREAFAAANAIQPQPCDASFDYRGKGGPDGLWLDFVADTGDGWNSTYAIARLLAEPALTTANGVLPRARILVMGGDQVYPTASRAEYDARLLAPFDLAYERGDGERQWPPQENPDLYAIPGNHDWYDGLNAFFGLFCRRRIAAPGVIGSERPGRVVGGRQTWQTRSYFALRLSEDWWLWGTDSQLKGYIDQPQIDYFQHVAREWMDKGSKLILCVGSPSWEYVDETHPDDAFENFSYLERLAGAARDKDGQPMGHRLKLVLTGDSHHYVRYVEDDRHYITCGGGGAFLHPTHHLTDKAFTSKYPQPGVAHDPAKGRTPRSFVVARGSDGKPAVYPDAGTSRWLTFWNLLFPIKNWKFPLLLLLPGYLLFIWLLEFNARLSPGSTLATVLSDAGSLGDAAGAYWRLALLSPWGVLLAGVAFLGYGYFADAKTRCGRFLGVGAAHALASGAVATLATCAFVRFAAGWWPRSIDDFGDIAAAAGLMIIAAGAAATAAAFVFGLYLIVMLVVFKRHYNEAFSSIGHRGYKCFLRMRIDPQGVLHLYPIGLTKVPFDRWDSPRNPDLSPHLIEGPVTLR
ncbi:MAG: hypothetical protein ABW128_11950 [Rhizorhabdus sp.]